MSWKETIIEVIRFCLKTKNKFGILRTFKWYLAAVVAICGPYNWHIYGKLGNTANEVSGGISSGDITNYTLYIVLAITLVYIIVICILNKKEVSRDNLFKEIYVPYFEVLFKDLGIENNCGWTYAFAIESYTEITKQRYYCLERLVDHCFKCQDNGGFVEINSICRNLGETLDDLLKIFNLHKRPFGNDGYYFGKFYKDLNYNPNYDSDVDDYNAEILLIGDLTFEVVRIANLLLDRIRAYYPSFMSEHGVITVRDAKDSNGKYNVPIVYKTSEISNKPYPGLIQFLSDRANRTHRYGTDNSILSTLQREGLIPRPRKIN